MNYWNAIQLAQGRGIYIQPYVIPLGLAWGMVNSTDIEVVENITWSAVSAQTSLMLADRELAQLESQPSVHKLKFLVKELGYRGVLLKVSSSKPHGSSGLYHRCDAYAYLADPDWSDWSEVGTELGKLIERVLAGWQEDKP